MPQLWKDSRGFEESVKGPLNLDGALMALGLKWNGAFGNSIEESGGRFPSYLKHEYL